MTLAGTASCRGNGGLPLVAMSSGSCCPRAQNPMPGISLSQTSCDLYSKPHAFSTAKAFSRHGTVVHMNKTQSLVAKSATGNVQISSCDMTGYSLAGWDL